MERGQCRPRRSLLHALALGISADGYRVIEARLAAAAGPDGLAADTPGWWGYRRKRLGGRS